MSGPPTLVFVPGAWHKATCYDRVIEPLREKHNINCVAVTLPSTTGNAEATFKDDVDAVRTAIATETTAGRDVIVVVHSYGGIVGESAVKGFTQASAAQDTPTSANPTGHVKALVLIATGFSITGLSFMDPFFGIPPPAWRVNKETGFADIVTSPRQLFYGDLEAEDAAYWVSQIMPQSLKALFEGGEHVYTGWKDVPVWFIGTVEDKGMPVAAQRLNVGMARGQGAVVHHTELISSHSPFLSMPEEVVEIIMCAVNAVAGPRREEEGTRALPERESIATPAVKLGSPSTWLKFGIPLLMGRGLGWMLFGFIELTRRVKMM
ncbi:hypothetical protein Q7P37_003267 [Cladosporium fusiforme]